MPLHAALIYQPTPKPFIAQEVSDLEVVAPSLGYRTHCIPPSSAPDTCTPAQHRRCQEWTATPQIVASRIRQENRATEKERTLWTSVTLAVVVLLAYSCVCGEIELSATSFPCCRISHPLLKQGETPVFKPERVTVSPEALASPFISRFRQSTDTSLTRRG